MSWFSFIAAVVKLLSGLMSYVSEKKLITAAEKAQLADLLLAEAENVDSAFKARLDQRLRDAAGVSDEDADRFRRD